MSVIKTFTLTTLEMDDPASSRTALRFWMQEAVFSWMVPVTRLPLTSQGICPEQ